MKIMLSIVLFTAACADNSLNTASSAVSTPDVDFYQVFPPDNVIESIMINNKTCGIMFHGVHDPAADTLAFWTVGVDAIKRTVPYPSKRPNFYAIFAPSNPTLNHTVPSFEAYDHYHVADAAAVGTDDDLVDAFVVNPGPNFNAATYQIAHSVKEMNAQVAAGILSAPVTTIDAGFGPIVFHGQVACGEDLEELYAGGADDHGH